jgi:very-short-patch-repair endonuclease
MVGRRGILVCGYFIDYYIPDLNIAIEFDEKAGHTTELQIQYDKEREKNIINEIGCIFYRVKEDDRDNDKDKVITEVKSFIEQTIKERIKC